MNMSRSPFGAPSQVGVRPAAALSASFLTQAFTWMFAGLLVTAGVAWFVGGSPQLRNLAADVFLFAIIGQLVLVVAISAGINKFGATIALGLFFVYAATLGLTVGLIVSMYPTESVAAAFLSASAMFGAAALYGVTTKRSLTGIGGFLMMGVVGLIVASVLNIFLGSSQLGWLISFAGVAIFTVLTAYDVQRISSGDLAAQYGSMEKAAVIGALRLYLDFINLFLFMLRLFGNRR